MISTFDELTCDVCGYKEQFEQHPGVKPHGWIECFEMANGEGSDNVMVMAGGLPLIPKRHICPTCAQDVFDAGDDDEDDMAIGLTD